MENIYIRSDQDRSDRSYQSFLEKGRKRKFKEKKKNTKGRKEKTKIFGATNVVRQKVVLISKGVVRQKVVLILERWKNKREEKQTKFLFKIQIQQAPVLSILNKQETSRVAKTLLWILLNDSKTPEDILKWQPWNNFREDI